MGKGGCQRKIQDIAAVTLERLALELLDRVWPEAADTLLAKVMQGKPGALGNVPPVSRANLMLAGIRRVLELAIEEINRSGDGFLRTEESATDWLIERWHVMGDAAAEAAMKEPIVKAELCRATRRACPVASEMRLALVRRGMLAGLDLISAAVQVGWMTFRPPLVGQSVPVVRIEWS